MGLVRQFTPELKLDWWSGSQFRKIGAWTGPNRTMTPLPIWPHTSVVLDFGAMHSTSLYCGLQGGLFGHVCLWCQILVPCVQLSQTMTLELRRHVTMGRSHDQTGSDPSRDLTCDKSCDQAPKPASNQSCDKKREHDLMHAYFCRCNLCYIHDRY
jgi:hypothetical protein